MAVSLEARLSTLERRLADAEQNEEWDAVEPELRKLRVDVWESLRTEQAELGRARADYRERFHWWDYVNPFDATARDRYQNTVSRKQFELEHERSVEQRLARLVEKFYADKTRPFARELIRIAEKVQRGVPGDWPVKAGAAFGGAVAGRTGDDAIAYAAEVTKALAGRYVDEGAAIGAAILSGKPPAEAAKRLAELSDGLGRDELSGRIAGAALLSGRADPAGFVKELRERMGWRAYDSDAVLVGAALLSGMDAERAHALMQLERPKIAAAAMLAGLEPKDASERGAKLMAELGGDPEAGETIAAALLMAGAEDAADAKALLAAAKGTWSAEATLVSAGLLANRPLDESVAFVRHVQQQLTGTWESEALVVAGGILRDADPPSKAAFLLPGMFTSAD